jgi:hypothetical protein
MAEFSDETLDRVEGVIGDECVDLDRDQREIVEKILVEIAEGQEGEILKILHQNEDLADFEKTGDLKALAAAIGRVTSHGRIDFVDRELDREVTAKKLVEVGDLDAICDALHHLGGRGRDLEAELVLVKGVLAKYENSSDLLRALNLVSLDSRHGVVLAEEIVSCGDVDTMVHVLIEMGGEGNELVDAVMAKGIAASGDLDAMFRCFAHVNGNTAEEKILADEIVKSDRFEQMAFTFDGMNGNTYAAQVFAEKVASSGNLEYIMTILTYVKAFSVAAERIASSVVRQGDMNLIVDVLKLFRDECEATGILAEAIVDHGDLELMVDFFEKQKPYLVCDLFARQIVVNDESGEIVKRCMDICKDEEILDIFKCRGVAASILQKIEEALRGVEA